MDNNEFRAISMNRPHNIVTRLAAPDVAYADATNRVIPPKWQGKRPTTVIFYNADAANMAYAIINTAQITEANRKTEIEAASTLVGGLRIPIAPGIYLPIPFGYDNGLTGASCEIGIKEVTMLSITAAVDLHLIFLYELGDANA